MLLDFVLFGLFVAVASVVIMIHTRVYRQFIQAPGGMPAYQDEVKQEINFYVTVTGIMFALWIIGWFVKWGSIGFFGIALAILFAFISARSALKVMCLGNDYLPADRTGNLPAE